MSKQNFHPHSENPSRHLSGAGQSNVGAPNIYGDGDQKNITEAEVERVSRESGHNLKGYMANNTKNHEGMAQVVADEKERMHPTTEADLSRKDPTLPAMRHNNEPSRGAKVDADLLAEDAEELRKKGKA